MRRRRKGGSGRRIWLEPFGDRVPGKDGFSFDIEYHIEARGTDAGSWCAQRSACATAVRTIVESILARRDVLRAVIAEQEVNLDLSRLMPLYEPGVVVTQSWVVVRVDSETAESAKRLADARQDVKADAVRRDGLRARMMFLETEVLRDKAALRLYLLAEGIERGRPATGTDLDELESLAEEVRQWSPANRWVATARILHNHFDRLPPPALLAFVSTLRDSLRDHENLDLLKQFDAVHGAQTGACTDRLPSHLPSMAPVCYFDSVPRGS